MEISDGVITTEIGVHYPYLDHFSILHIHLRSKKYPHSDSCNDRGLYLLKDIVNVLQADGNCMKHVTLCGVLTN